MAKKEIRNEKMKFGEWRPIGVCDNGVPNTKQAKMFTRKDFLTITASHVNRNNWKQQPEVMKVIRRYGMDVAAKSTMTRGMKKPVVKDVKLVGTILHYKKTPTLSNESRDGKLQLFQVEFEDKGKKRKSWWGAILIALLSLILIVIGGLLVMKLNRPKVHKVYRAGYQSVEVCESGRNTGQYFSDLESMQQQLNRYLRTALDDPYHPSNAFCFETTYSVEKREETLIKCYGKSKTSGNGGHQSLLQVQKCVMRICQKNSGALSPYCR